MNKNIFFYKDFHVILYNYKPSFTNGHYFNYYPKSLVYWKGMLLCINKSKNIYSNEEHCGRLAREFVAYICRIPVYNLLFNPKYSEKCLSMKLEVYEE